MKVILYLFVFVPLLEILAVLFSGRWIGVWPTIGMIVATGILGAMLAKKEGLKALRNFQDRMRNLDAPGIALIDGLLIGIAGILLILPGFVTDLIGFLLLISSVRKSLYPFILKKIEKKYRNNRIIVINGDRNNR